MRDESKRPAQRKVPDPRGEPGTPKRSELSDDLTRPNTPSRTGQSDEARRYQAAGSYVTNTANGTHSGPLLQAHTVNFNAAGRVDLESGSDDQPPKRFTTDLALIVAAGLFAASSGVALMASSSMWATVLLAVATLLVMVWVIRRARRPASVSDRIALSALRTAVRDGWSEEAANRGLYRPQPLRLRWRPTTTGAVVDSGDGRGYAQENAPRGALVQGSSDLRPAAHALAAAFTDERHQQLVVLGEPGAGKTTLAVLFTLAMIEETGSTDPVPVLLSVAGWEPGEPVEDWCVRRIGQTYPDFGEHGVYGPERLRRLLRDRQVVPVLDGLDEMPAASLPRALEVLDKSAGSGRRMVLTCRSVEFQRAVDEAGPLSHAAVVDVEPVTVDDSVDFLVQREKAGSNRWDEVVASLRQDRDREWADRGPVSRALSTPLMLSLAKRIYGDRPTAEPRRLLEFGSAKEIEHHLLDEFLPSVFDTERERDQATRWLSFLADHLERGDDPNWEWWRLARDVPRWVIPAAVTLIATVLGSLAFAVFGLLTIGDGEAAAVGAVLGGILGMSVGAMAGLHAGRTIEVSERKRQRDLVLGVMVGTAADLRTLLTVMAGLSAVFISVAYAITSSMAVQTADTILDLVTNTDEILPSALIVLDVTLFLNVLGVGRAGVPQRRAPQLRRLIPNVASGMLIGLALATPWWIYSESIETAIGLAPLIGIPTGVGRWLASPVEHRTSGSPRSVLAGDRTALFIAAGGISMPPIVLTMVGLWNLAETFAIGLVVTAIVVLGSGSAWLSYTLARLWLALRGHLPWQLMRFLRRAHAAGVLRQSGPAYQLRHDLLRAHLALRWRTTRSSRRTGQMPRASSPAVLGRRGWWHPLARFCIAVSLLATTIAFVQFRHPQLPEECDDSEDIALSPDGRTAAIASNKKGLVCIWGIAEERLIDTTPIPDSPYASPFAFTFGSSVAFDSNNHVLLTRVLLTPSSETDRRIFTIEVLDTTTENRRYAFHVPGYYEIGAMSSDGRFVATTSYKEVSLWDSSTGERIRSFPSSGPAGVSLDSSADTITISYPEQETQVWRVTDDRGPLRTFDSSRDSCVALSDDGRSVFIGDNGSVHLKEISTGRRLGGTAGTSYCEVNHYGPHSFPGGLYGRILVTIDQGRVRVDHL